MNEEFVENFIKKRLFDVKIEHRQIEKLFEEVLKSLPTEK